MPRMPRGTKTLGVRQGEGLRRFLKEERMRLGLGARSNGNGISGEENAVRLLLAAGEESDPTS